MDPALLIESGLGVLAALAAGALVKKLHLPKVIGYIAAGMLIGPSVARLLTKSDLEGLQLIERLALGVIMFRFGREFTAAPFRKLGRRVIVTVCCVVGVTFGVTLGVMAAAGAGTMAAVLLALIAVTTSPAAIVVVVREYDSEGPLTEILLTVVAVGNVIGLVLFDLAIPLVTGHPAADHGALAGVLGALAGVGGSIVLGAALGLVLGASERISASASELIAVTVAMLLVAIGASDVSGFERLDPLLAAIVFGAVYANASTKGAGLFEQIRRVDMIVYCLFFIMVGAEVDFAAIGTVAVLVGPYIVARIAGIVIGSMLGTRLTGERRDVRLYLGWALLPTGGVAIAMAHALPEFRLDGTPMAPVVALALGAVAFFELTGPLVVKYVLVHVGEVKLISLVAEHGVFQALGVAVSQVRRVLGIPSYRTLPLRQVTARHVMRTHVETLAQNARVPQIIRAMAHSGYDLLPVVDEEGCLHGAITLSGIRNVTFDPALANLVIARDLASFDFPVVYEEDTLSDVMGKFADQPGELATLPVVDDEDHTHLIGMIDQRDVLDAVHLVDRTRRTRMAQSEQGDVDEH